MLRRATVLLCGAFLIGCQSRTEVGMSTIDADSLRLAAAEEGPWKPEVAFETIGGPWRVTHGTFAQTSVGEVRAPARAVDPFARRPAPAAPPAPIPSGPKLAPLRRRARKEARPVGKATGKGSRQLAREHFLDYPTRIRAQKVTLHVPPAYVHAARLTGQSVGQARGGRRTALGAARLTLRELTLEGDRITLRARTDGLDDIQIMARGNVRFVANVRGNILREEGLRSLLITNDQVVPIR